MKKTAQKNTRRAAALPAARLDVHPNVIRALHVHANGSEDLIFEHVIRPPAEVGQMTKIISDGLKVNGYKVSIRKFDATGQPIK